MSQQHCKKGPPLATIEYTVLLQKEQNFAAVMQRVAQDRGECCGVTHGGLVVNVGMYGRLIK